MRVRQLLLENIGPFIKADMQIFTKGDEKPPVVLITGENGTGKSIILDAIRGMFGPQYATLERDIRRQNNIAQANIEFTLQIEHQDLSYKSTKILENQIQPNKSSIANIPGQIPYDSNNCPNWVVDFWASTLASGSYKINTFTNPKHKQFLIKALQGIKTKSVITELICYFDYMRDSRDPQEQATGERLYEILGDIVAKSLLSSGKLSHIARSTFQPIIIQNGQPVYLENLSSGNSYLIQNLVNLLGKMHAVHFLRKTPLSELGQTPGLLLIDEAENQLHPKWQKRLMRTILDIFPNLQIIATTHSPFIISSVPNARLFVCKSMGDHCIIEDETAEYSNKPVDEILMSPLFEETYPFNEEITTLIEARTEAIKNGDKKERQKIEEKLKRINPQYFAYFDVDKLLQKVTKGV